MVALAASNNVGEGHSSDQAAALSSVIRAFNRKVELEVNTIYTEETGTWKKI